MKSEVTIPYSPTEPLDNETQEQVVSAVQEKIVIQPIIQPIQVQGEESLITWASYTPEPSFEEIITPAESWTWQNIAKPIQAKGVKVYNEVVPINEVRPQEYVVMSVDNEIRDIGFADNTNYNEESFIILTIQGHGNTFENWVVEASKFTHEILRGYRERGIVHSISNRKIGFDETTQMLSQTISFWLVY